MNSNDFISLKGVKWGEYPYYYGDTYNEGSIYFATLGCKKAFQYKDFAEGMTSINVSEKANYLSLYNNGGLKEYYGDGLFQKNNNLATSEDFIRNNNAKIAIPTEAELKRLINSSDISCYNGKLLIQPYETNNGVKTYKGDIWIPLLGIVNYKADKVSTTTKYDVRNGSLKQVGIGFHKGIHEKDWTGTPPSGFPFVIVETRYTSNGLSSYEYYKCYEGGYYYSDVFLLTSSIPKDESGNIITNKDTYGKTFARVLRIEIEADVLPDDESTPEYGDVEFLSFKVKVNSKNEQLIYFENIKCCDGTTAEYKDRGFMVLPIRYDGNISVETNGGLLINENNFFNYNQDADKTSKPYFLIAPFGIPQITNGNYNYVFERGLIGTHPISTLFSLPNGFNSSIIDFKSYNYIDDKIKVYSNTNKSYWIISNSECLYIKKTSTNTYNLIFDDRPLFGSSNNATILDIYTNIDYQEEYTVSSDRFVLPSIYKPFYIKRIYSIDRFNDIESSDYNCSVYTSVYNGIGLFAHKGESTSGSTSGGTYVSTVSNEPSTVGIENVVGGAGGFINSNLLPNLPDVNVKAESMGCGSTAITSFIPNNLKTKLNSYFNYDVTFSESFEVFYEAEKYNDIYVVGYTDDKVELSTSDKTYKIELFGDYPLPIYRKRPLILSDYNNSVFDFLDSYAYSITSGGTLERTYVSTVEFFKSVEEPKTKMSFNKNKSGGIMSGSIGVGFAEIDITTEEKFGNFFGTYYGYTITDVCFATQPNSFGNPVFKNYISEGRENGIRYYLVNYAFYSNYINNVYRQYEGYVYDFIRYNDEYYKNREYYDLNPHVVDFKDSDTWYSTTDISYEKEESAMLFGLYPSNTGLNLSDDMVTISTGLIDGKDTWSVYVNKDSAILYNIVSSIKYVNSIDFNLQYKVSFWILNSDAATIRVRVKLGDYKDIASFSSSEDEANGKAPYRIFIIKPNEKRYVEFVGYPFKEADIQLWVRPEYINVNTNEYYRVSFRISQVNIETITYILPFFDMIPALKNTKGYVYSDDREPNFNAPMAIELYADSDSVDFIRQESNTEVDTTTFLIGVYNKLTKLDGPCCAVDSSLKNYGSINNRYFEQIKNGSEILPQNNDRTIIYCYGVTHGWR